MAKQNKKQYTRVEGSDEIESGHTKSTSAPKSKIDLNLKQVE